MQHLQPNTTLQGGKYRIERVLGQGGFGITYLAVQTSLNRYVAIKEFFMKDFCSHDEATLTMLTSATGGGTKLVMQYRNKFIKEAKNLARLHHSNIINVIEVFEENGTVYYSMPYLSGGSLQDYVNTYGALSEADAMKYVRQIASALKYMHEEQHICHYDVKPANILLDDKGNAILIDFGISKNYDASGHETTTTPIGLSEGYAPIEQYQQNVEEFSPASDVYALGATLYFLLHAKRPVSAVHRASGTPLVMDQQLSQGVKDIINASMKISKRERTNSVDVFSSTSSTSGKSYGWILIIALIIIGIGFGIYIKNQSPQMEDPQGISDSPIPGTKENTKTQIETSTSQPIGEMTPVDLFNEKIRGCKWHHHSSGDYRFKYPDFMEYTTYFVGDVPGDVEVFSWEDVELAYWPLLGCWAVDIAEKGNYITQSTTISNVTYKAESKGIFSGYTSDGRIYYLKTKVLDGGEVPHVTVLALIYPKEFKGHMDELTEIVMRW